MSEKKCKAATKLCEETAEAYYWSGFLAADGSVGRGGAHIKLTLKDHDHVLKFAEFVGWGGAIGSDGQGKYRTVAFYDSSAVRAWASKFDIKPRKTYNPPSMIPGSGDLKFSYAVGFIDGDGSIQKQCGDRRGALLSVKCHCSWLSLLTSMQEALSDNRSGVKINAAGYARFMLSEHAVLKAIHARALGLGLPLMRRKWDVIDHDFVSSSETAKSRVEELRRLLAEGVQKSVIARKMGVTPGAVTRMIKYNGIKTYKGRGPKILEK